MLTPQIFVHGERTQSILVAVVVPSEKTSSEQEILEELCAIGKRAELPAYSIPVAVILAREEWTPENGLLSATRKPCRPKLLSKFRSAIDSFIEPH